MGNGYAVLLDCARTDMFINRATTETPFCWHVPTCSLYSTLKICLSSFYYKPIPTFPATAFGEGVYFATHAAYSCSNTYSRPSAHGIKYIYICCVLTGEYTLGKNDIRVPPSKSHSQGDQYDSVVNNVSSPTIFVIFMTLKHIQNILSS